MSNNYNVEVPEGAEYPTQKFVDDVLNGIDAIPTCHDLERLIEMGEAAAKAYIAAQLEKMEKKLNDFFAGVKDSAERQMEPIEPLIEPPSSIDDVLDYLKSVAEYFAGPYYKMVEMLKFYAEFSAAAASAIAAKAADTGCLVNFAPPSINVIPPPPEPEDEEEEEEPEPGE